MNLVPVLLMGQQIRYVIVGQLLENVINVQLHLPVVIAVHTVVLHVVDFLEIVCLDINHYILHVSLVVSLLGQEEVPVM